VPALKGWRRQLFGDAALKLKNGKIALGFNGKNVMLIEVAPERLDAEAAE
jgi:ribonuclease D